LDDFSRPLGNCRIYMDGFTQNAKVVVPKQMDELVSNGPVSRLARCRRLFNFWILYLPLTCILCMDTWVSFRLSQVNAVVPSSDEEFPNHPVWPKFFSRKLQTGQRVSVPNRGSCDTGLKEAGVEASCPTCNQYYDGRYDKEPSNWCQFVPHQNMCYPAFWVSQQGLLIISDCTEEVKEAKRDFSVQDMQPTRSPTITERFKEMLTQAADRSAETSPPSPAAVVPAAAAQVFLAALQLLAGLLLTQVVLRACNHSRVSLEQQLKKLLEEQKSEVAEKIYSKAFREMRSTADAFFPEFKLRISQLRTSLEASGFGRLSWLLPRTSSMLPVPGGA